MINAQELKKGQFIIHEGALYKIISADYHVGGGKVGGMVHAKMRNLKTGHLSEHRFVSHDKLEDVSVDRTTMDYLYATDQECCFMNPQTFEQVSLPLQNLGPIIPYLKEGMKLQIEYYEGNPVSVDMPAYVYATVSSTAAGIRGETGDSTYKTATLDNGQEILVPQFIKTGDQIKIEIETGKYVERMQEKKK